MKLGVGPRMWIRFVLMPIRIRIGIKMEIRIRIGIKKRCRSTILVANLSLVSGEEGGAGGDGEDGGEAQAARQAEAPHDQGPAGGGLGGAGSHGGQGIYLLGYTCGLTSGGPGRAFEEVSGSGCGGGWALPAFCSLCRLSLHGGRIKLVFLFATFFVNLLIEKKKVIAQTRKSS
jgi:hypothetical protein